MAKSSRYGFVRWAQPWLVAVLLLLFIGSHDAEARRRRQQPSSPADIAYSAARTKYYELITSNQTSNESEWQICVEMFRKVWRDYPQSHRSADAIFTQGLLYWNMHQRFGRQETLYQAIETYETLLKTYPSSSLGDAALYNIAMIYFEDLGDKEKAVSSLQLLKQKYPRSPMVAQADQLLEKLHTAGEKTKPAVTSTSTTLSSSPVVVTNKAPAQATAPAATAPSNILVEEIRSWSNPDYTRVSIYLNGKAGFEHRMLKKDPQLKTPYRLYIDIPAKLSAQAQRNIDIADSLLQRVRAGQYTKDTARVVLDMNSVYDYQISWRGDPDRIIIDVQGSEPKQQVPPPVEVAEDANESQDSTKAASQENSAPVVAAAPSQAPIHKDAEKEVLTILEGMEQDIKPAPQPRRENVIDLKKVPTLRTVIIDAGHGGDDPGAKGPTGVMEKDVVLGIALRLRDMLSAVKGLRVVMTRDTDVFIPLEQRSRLANQERGDLFISIHANASPKKKVSGISTYVFDNAKDDYSKKLEELENASIIRGEKQEADFLSLMFRSMTKNYFTNQSVELAGSVQSALVNSLKTQYGGVRDLGVRQAMFYVLWNTEMPAILVEASFITNRTEENRLRNNSYQSEVAGAIAKGVGNYLQERYAMQVVPIS